MSFQPLAIAVGQLADVPRLAPSLVLPAYRSTGNVWETTPKQCPGI